MESLVIWAAVHHRYGHPSDNIPFDGLNVLMVKYAADSTHGDDYVSGKTSDPASEAEMRLRLRKISDWPHRCIGTLS